MDAPEQRGALGRGSSRPGVEGGTRRRRQEHGLDRHAVFDRTRDDETAFGDEQPVRAQPVRISDVPVRREPRIVVALD